MRVLLHSREVIDPLQKGGPYFRASFQVIEDGGRIAGKAWVRGMPHLTVSQDQPIDEPPLQAAKSMKWWLDVELKNLIVEFDERMKQ